MPEITCFMIEPAGTVRRWLRRYSPSQWDKAANRAIPVCGANPYHNAQVPIEDGVLLERRDAGGFLYHDTQPREWPRDDPRWPTHCDACGYVFTDADVWQLHWHALYRRVATGEVVGHLHPSEGRVPPGAMWDTPWFLPQWAGPDGRCLSVMTPGGEWCIDGPSSGGDRRPWQRTGEPPTITATPSILIGDRYHGWLTNGVLRDA